MVKRSPTLGTLVTTKTKCIKLIFIGLMILVPVAFLMALSIFSMTVARRCFFSGFMLFLSCFLCFCARLFIDALWSPAGKGLTSWLSFVMSNCEVVTFPLVSWVRCGA